MNERQNFVQCRTPNGRFGAMAAVAPQKRQCVNESLSPAGKYSEAAAAPSRCLVRCHAPKAKWK